MEMASAGSATTLARADDDRSSGGSADAGMGVLSMTPPPREVADAYGERLRRFYRVHAPEKLPTVGEALFAFRGREEEMFRLLEEKYGPEPPLRPTIPAVELPSPAVLVVDREGLGDLPSTFPSSSSCAAVVPSSANAAQRVQLPPPPAATAHSPRDFRVRLLWMYLEYCPERILNADMLLLAYRGREEAMMRDVVRHLGPEPDVAERRARLVAFYRYYCPEKIDAVDDILLAFAGEVDVLFKTLVGLYGREPLLRSRSTSATSAAASVAAAASSSSSVCPTAGAAGGDGPAAASDDDDFMFEETTRQRLREFYAHYAPGKLCAVEDIAALYTHHGRGHRELFEQLERKYGPEPAKLNSSGGEASAEQVRISGEETRAGRSGDCFKCSPTRNRRILRQRVEDFCFFYDLDDAPEIAAAASVSEAGADAFMADLVSRFGAEPDARAVADMRRVRQAAAAARAHERSTGAECCPRKRSLGEAACAAAAAQRANRRRRWRRQHSPSRTSDDSDDDDDAALCAEGLLEAVAAGSPAELEPPALQLAAESARNAVTALRAAFASESAVVAAAAIGFIGLFVRDFRERNGGARPNALRELPLPGRLRPQGVEEAAFARVLSLEELADGECDARGHMEARAEEELLELLARASEQFELLTFRVAAAALEREEDTHRQGITREEHGRWRGEITMLASELALAAARSNGPSPPSPLERGVELSGGSDLANVDRRWAAFTAPIARSRSATVLVGARRAAGKGDAPPPPPPPPPLQQPESFARWAPVEGRDASQFGRMSPPSSAVRAAAAAAAVASPPVEVAQSAAALNVNKHPEFYHHHRRRPQQQQQQQRQQRQSRRERGSTACGATPDGPEHVGAACSARVVEGAAAVSGAAASDDNDDDWTPLDEGVFSVLRMRHREPYFPPQDLAEQLAEKREGRYAVQQPQRAGRVAPFNTYTTRRHTHRRTATASVAAPPRPTPVPTVAGGGAAGVLCGARARVGIVRRGQFSRFICAPAAEGEEGPREGGEKETHKDALSGLTLAELQRVLRSPRTADGTVPSSCPPPLLPPKRRVRGAAATGVSAVLEWVDSSQHAPVPR